MITVHHLNNSRSQRILWLLEELGLTYEIKHYQRDAKTSLAPPELFKIHPLGKSPVVTDGDAVLAESGAIVEYLVETYGKGAWVPPAGTPEKRRYTYWMHFAEGTAMPYMVTKLVLNRIERAPMPFFAKPIAKAIAGKAKAGYTDPNIARIAEYVDGELGRSEWFAGDKITGADIQMFFAVEALAIRGGGQRPNMMRFLDRVHNRPAYKRALERGGPFGLLA